MRKLYLTTLTCLLLVSITALSQSDSLKIDSLKKVLLTEKEDTNMVKTLNKLGDLLGDVGEYEEALEYSLKSLTIAEKTSFPYGAGFAHYLIGSYMAMLTGKSEEKFPATFAHLSAALSVFEDFKDKVNIANCYKSIGFAYSYILDDIPEAMTNMYKALKLYEELGDNENVSAVLFYISDAKKTYLADDAGSLENLSASIDILRNVKTAWAIESANLMMAELLIQQQRYAEAFDKISVALKVYRDSTYHSSDNFVPIGCLNETGKVYESIGDSAFVLKNISFASIKYKQALDKYMEAQNLQLPGDLSAAHQLNLIGTVYIKMGRRKDARAALDIALVKADSMHQKVISRNAHLYLSRLDSLEGNFKESSEHFKKYILIRDTLANNENDKKILQTKLMYEFDKKEAVAKSKQDKKDTEAKRLKTQQYFVIAALGIVVLAVVIIAFIQYKNNQNKQKANTLLQQQKDKVESTLSELKSAQAQLIQHEKMASLGELTAGIAHEIQNPLNFVNNFSEVNTELSDELEQEAENGNIDEIKIIAKDIRANSEKINHHGKRADAIVKGMLQHSKTSTGVKELTDINALADEYLRLAYHGIRGKDSTFNVTMKTDFDETIERVNIISQDIGRVMLNLYNNAFYAASLPSKGGFSDSDKRSDPTLWVSTKKIGDKVLITVKDNGNGIPRNIFDKIFQPFFTTKPTGQGTGLGLSLSYDIVKAHGGEIKVESQEGEFTRFTIVLPG